MWYLPEAGAASLYIYFYCWNLCILIRMGGVKDRLVDEYIDMTGKSLSLSRPQYISRYLIILKKLMVNDVGGIIPFFLSALTPPWSADWRLWWNSFSPVTCGPQCVWSLLMLLGSRKINYSWFRKISLVSLHFSPPRNALAGNPRHWSSKN